jgi:predicted anti-sigma-YlaC factor YlaD
MSTITCATAREEIQSCHDGCRNLDPAVAAHLVECPACRRFQDFTAGLGGRLKSEMDVRVLVSMPDSGWLVRQSRLRRKRRRIVNSLSGLAAALVISLGTVITNGAMREARIREQVSEETQYFIDDLFSRPLFEEIEYTQ